MMIWWMDVSDVRADLRITARVYSIWNVTVSVNFPISQTHTGLHTNEIVCLMKNFILKKNVVNICIIYDLFYPPANNQNAFFLLPDLRFIRSASGYNCDRTTVLFFQ